MNFKMFLFKFIRTNGRMVVHADDDADVMYTIIV